MKTSADISLQEDFELHSFLNRLASGELRTPDLRSAMMIFRQRSGRESALVEWADSIAHQKRNRGVLFDAVANLWIEVFGVNAFFRSPGNRDEPPEQIPAIVFNKLVELVQSPAFGKGDAGVKFLYPEGCPAEEIVASLRYMYQQRRRSKKEDARPSDPFRLVSKEDVNPDDLHLMRYLSELLENSHWGSPPFHIDEIIDEIASILHHLVGCDPRDVGRHSDLLSLHFLCAFHLIEVDLKDLTTPDTRAHLSVDVTRSNHLSLNVALYQIEGRDWDQIELNHERRHPEATASHTYSRPFLVTDLLAKDYLDSDEFDEGDWVTLFGKAIAVSSNSARPTIVPAEGLPLPTYRYGLLRRSQQKSPRR